MKSRQNGERCCIQLLRLAECKAGTSYAGHMLNATAVGNSQAVASPGGPGDCPAPGGRGAVVNTDIVRSVIRSAHPCWMLTSVLRPKYCAKLNITVAWRLLT